MTGTGYSLENKGVTVDEGEGGAKENIENISSSETNGTYETAGLDINYGLGFGYKTNFGSLMFKFFNTKLYSNSFDLENKTMKTKYLKDNEDYLVFSAASSLPLINLGANVDFYEKRNPKISATFLSGEYNFYDNTYKISQEYELHFGIIGAKGYIETNNFEKVFFSVPNFRQNFYERTGSPIWTR